MSSKKLITIDGPSASGKSSVSRMTAKQLGWQWVSTGAFYRGLALAALKLKISDKDEAALAQLAQADSWSVKMTSGDTQVWFQGNDCTNEIFGEEVGALASNISQLSKVREALLQRQRDCFDPSIGLVAEGRDCGTVVFPDATAKVFLTASPATRALRRAEEESESQEKTQEMQALRDAQDSERKVSPLKMAEGALHIDSSFLSLDEVVAEVLKYFKSQE